ncbi:MAG: TIR domain-containing protein, partial [Frankia sp.]
MFVSYARADETYVDQLAAHLRTRGLTVWTDGAIDFGAQWPQAIADNIDSCAAFVVVMSPAGRQSAWVGREVLRAQEHRKPIFPLLLAGEAFFEVSDLQYSNVSGSVLPSDRWIARLAGVIPPADAAASPTAGIAPGAGLSVPSRVLTGHTNAVRSAAFSPDGAILATASDDRTV